MTNTIPCSQDAFREFPIPWNQVPEPGLPNTASDDPMLIPCGAACPINSKSSGQKCNINTFSYIPIIDT